MAKNQLALPGYTSNELFKPIIGESTQSKKPFEQTNDFYQATRDSNLAIEYEKYLRYLGYQGTIDPNTNGIKFAIQNKSGNSVEVTLISYQDFTSTTQQQKGKLPTKEEYIAKYKVVKSEIPQVSQEGQPLVIEASATPITQGLDTSSNSGSAQGGSENKAVDTHTLSASLLSSFVANRSGYSVISNDLDEFMKEVKDNCLSTLQALKTLFPKDKKIKKILNEIESNLNLVTSFVSTSENAEDLATSKNNSKELYAIDLDAQYAFKQVILAGYAIHNNCVKTTQDLNIIFQEDNNGVFEGKKIGESFMKSHTKTATTLFSLCFPNGDISALWSNEIDPNQIIRDLWRNLNKQQKKEFTFNEFYQECFPCYESAQEHGDLTLEEFFAKLVESSKIAESSSTDESESSKGENEKEQENTLNPTQPLQDSSIDQSSSDDDSGSSINKEEDQSTTAPVENENLMLYYSASKGLSETSVQRNDSPSINFSDLSSSGSSSDEEETDPNTTTSDDGYNSGNNVPNEIVNSSSSSEDATPQEPPVNKGFFSGVFSFAGFFTAPIFSAVSGLSSLFGFTKTAPTPEGNIIPNQNENSNDPTKNGENTIPTPTANTSEAPAPESKSFGGIIDSIFSMFHGIGSLFWGSQPTAVDTQNNDAQVLGETLDETTDNSETE